MKFSKLKTSNYKKVLNIGFTIILLAGLLSGLVLVRKPQELREQAATVFDAQLFFTPNSLKVEPNSQGNTYDIYMDTKGMNVTSLVLEVSYNPKMISLNEIENEWVVYTDDSGNPQKAIILATDSGEVGLDNVLAIAQITLGTSNPPYTSNGVIKIATLNFNALDQEGTMPIGITSASKIAAKGVNEDILATRTGGNITITSVSETPTISPTPTPSSTPTPTPSPTPTSKPKKR